MNVPQQNDTFVTETYVSAITHRNLTEWAYRDASGDLYAGIAEDEEEAVQAACLVGYVPPEDEDAAIDATMPDLTDPKVQDAALELLLTLEGFDFGQGSGNIHVARMLTAIHNKLYDEWATETLKPA